MEGFIGNGRETCDFPCQAAEGLDDHHYRIIKGKNSANRNLTKKMYNMT
jgi:hypothetical protein